MKEVTFGFDMPLWDCNWLVNALDVCRPVFICDELDLILAAIFLSLHFPLELIKSSLVPMI